MKFNPLRWPLTCIGGTLVIIFYCAFTFTSAALFPLSWSPFPYLSAFGDRVDSPSGAIFYNAGCILTGLALMVFYIGIYKWYTREIWRKVPIIVSQVVGVFSAFALMMIGVFPGDTGAPHMFWSAAFFALNFIVIVLLSISLISHPRFIKAVGLYGFSIAILSLLFDLTIGGAIIEWFTVFSSLSYAGLLIYNTFRLQSK